MKIVQQAIANAVQIMYVVNAFHRIIYMRI